MINKQFLSTLIGGLVISVISYPIAAQNSLQPPSDPNNCWGFMQLANTDPAKGTSSENIPTLQTCLSSCDQLYDSWNTPDKVNDMLNGINYCRFSLQTVYNQTIYQVTKAQLDSQTNSSSGGTTGSTGTVGATKQPSGAATTTAPTSAPPPSSTPPAQEPAPPPAAPATPASPGINWF